MTSYEREYEQLVTAIRKLEATHRFLAKNKVNVEVEGGSKRKFNFAGDLRKLIDKAVGSLVYPYDHY